MKALILIWLLFVSGNISAQVTDTGSVKNTDKQKGYYTVNNKNFYITGSSPKKESENPADSSKNTFQTIEKTEVIKSIDTIKTADTSVMSVKIQYNTNVDDPDFQFYNDADVFESNYYQNQEIVIEGDYIVIEDVEVEKTVEVVEEKKETFQVHYVKNKNNFSNFKSKKRKEMKQIRDKENKKVRHFDCYSFKR